MPSVMIRRNSNGQLTLYVAKRDLEENIVSIEFDSPERWGGEVVLADGSAYHIDPIAPPHLPVTVRARRAGGAD